VAAVDVEFTGGVSNWSRHWLNRKGKKGETYDPQRAVYSTFTIMSVGSWIFGIGRSSRTTFLGPLKTTAFIVSEDIVVAVLK